MGGLLGATAVATLCTLAGCGPTAGSEEDLDADGFTVAMGDCDDGDASVHPGAPESWYDGIDQDCDGAPDDDQDGDGHPSRRVPGGTDCWDDDARLPDPYRTLNGFTPEIEAKDVYPGAPERWYDGVDADCAGDGDFDADGDGHETAAYPSDGVEAFGADCRDADPTVSPDSDEVCDGQDNDCDGRLPTEESDDDGDGFVECAGDPGGWDGVGSMGFEDCDDADATAFPLAPELCDGRDNDCDGEPDPAESDHDEDGFVGCEGEDGGWRGPEPKRFGDCDDFDERVNPAAAEVCDGQDDDCDGELSPEEVDDDADGYVDCFEDSGGWDHAPAPGFGDCDDADPAVYPGSSPWCGTSSLGDVALTLAGSGGKGAAGTALGHGDLDGDGRPEVLVGDPEHGSDGGAVFAIAAPIGGDRSLQDADVVLSGWGNQGAGFALSGGSDIDGDGFHDLVVGAPEADGDGSEDGLVFLVWGPVTGEVELRDADLTLEGQSNYDHAGHALSTGGDVDGDGLPDLVIGAPEQSEKESQAGAVYVVSRPSSQALSLSSADTRFTGDSPHAGAGVSVSSAGDVDGDGVADVFLGAAGDVTAGEDAGAAYLFLGPAEGERSLSTADAALFGANAGDRAGGSVASAGDADGDGHDDLLVGATEARLGVQARGGAYLVHGPVTAELFLDDADAALRGERDGDEAGHSVAFVGDVDGDGFEDLLVGAPGRDSDHGVAYLVYGPVSGSVLLAESGARFQGAAPEDRAGSAVSPASDVDGDGLPDLLVGAPGRVVDGEEVGGASLILTGGE